MLGCYFLSDSKFSFWWLLGVGLFFRGSLFFFAPQWSEDGVRFLWDGELLRQGQNPYQMTPAQVQEERGQEEAEYRTQLFEELNSPHYYSVYPPLNQVLFWGAAQFAQGNLEKGYLALRLLLLLGEVGVFLLLCWLLARIGLPKNRSFSTG